MSRRLTSVIGLVTIIGLATCGGSNDPDTQQSSSELSAIGPTDVIPGTQQTPGPVSASHDVTHSGQFHYSVPLWVVPGRVGMQPKLALSYTSGGPTTHLGRGFALSGESAISRCHRTFARDGAPGAIGFDDGDAFCLDGARLVLVTGKNGVGG